MQKCEYDTLKKKNGIELVNVYVLESFCEVFSFLI